MNMLHDRVAIVTGASSGIGRACARHFAQEGAAVIACARRKPLLDQLADEFRAGGGKALAITCDVSEPAQIKAVVEAAISTFGKIDILANIAQGGLDEQEYLTDLTEERALFMYRTAAVQSLQFMQACLPHMQARGYGRIINTGSHAAVNGEPGFAAYAIAKGAVLTLSRVAAKEWARFGIVTNTILPVVRTDAYDNSAQGREAAERLAATNPTGRLGSPEECAPLLAFLASEGAGYINGQVIGIDGGGMLLA